MKMLCKVNGYLDHINVRRIDSRVLADTAREVAEQSTFGIFEGEDDIYYMNDYENGELRRVGTLEDLNEVIECYAEE